MRTEELMQNDWVKLKDAPIFCKVCYYTESGDVYGKTAGGGMFVKKAADLAPVELTQDIILRTSFWMKNRNLFRKTVAGIAAFYYKKDIGLLQVKDAVTAHVNNHHITCLHALQQLYRHYTSMELEVDMTRNKRKEYGQKYNSRRKENDGEDEE